MPAANVPLIVDQGEDFTAHVIWVDELGEPMPIVSPMKMEMKTTAGSPVLSLDDAAPPEGYIPELSYSSEIGLIQIHIERSQTAAIKPGQYVYDLFVSVDDGNEYAGVQAVRLMAGEVTVNKRFTQMS